MNLTNWSRIKKQHVLGLTDKVWFIFRKSCPYPRKCWWRRRRTGRWWTWSFSYTKNYLIEIAPQYMYLFNKVVQSKCKHNLSRQEQVTKSCTLSVFVVWQLYRRVWYVPHCQARAGLEKTSRGQVRTISRTTPLGRSWPARLMVGKVPECQCKILLKELIGNK